MGRWTQNNAVEDHYSVSTKFLNKHGYFKGYQCGNVFWTNSFGERTASIGVYVSVGGWQGEIRFQYNFTDRLSDKKTQYDYMVRLVATPCRYGGKRWWFICPLINGGVNCQRRVGVLYLGGRYFGCRKCLNLVYQSSKDSHKFDRMFMSMGIDSKIGNKFLKMITTK